MPNRDGTGPRGKGPKKINRGTPTPVRRGAGRGGSTKRSGKR